MAAIPIPVRLAQRPTQGGLAVPWVSTRLGDGTHDLGNLHNTRVSRCFLNRLCQTCGQRLGRTIVFLLPASRLDDMTTSEPGMHPECANYAAKACPMVNGRLAHYRDKPSRVHGPAGERCFEPGCDCGGWVPVDGGSDNAGRPAQEWFAVWCRDYDTTVPDEETAALIAQGKVPTGVSLGARIADPLKVRKVAHG